MNEFGNAIKMLELLSDKELYDYFDVYVRDIFSEENQSIEDGVSELLELAKVLNESGPSRVKFGLISMLNDLKEEKIVDDDTFNKIFSVLL